MARTRRTLETLPACLPSYPNVPARLAHLGTLLAWLSLTLVIGGLGFWLAVDRDSLKPLAEHGPWPIVLGLGFVLGLVGAGCTLVALALGGVPRRRVVGAMTISLVAPTLVGITALGLFFAATTFSAV